MADFGDDIGSEAMQQLRFGARRGSGIMSRLLDWAMSRDPAGDHAPIDPRTGEKIEQLDFDTPDDARAFADALAARGIEAEVAASSVVVRGADIDALIENGGLSEIGLSAQRAVEAARGSAQARMHGAKEARGPMPRVRDLGEKCKAGSNQLSAERASRIPEKAFHRELPVRA